MMLCGFLFIQRWFVMTQTTDGAILVISQVIAQRLKFSLQLYSILDFSERVVLKVQQEYLRTYYICMYVTCSY